MKVLQIEKYEIFQAQPPINLVVMSPAADSMIFVKCWGGDREIMQFFHDNPELVSSLNDFKNKPIIVSTNMVCFPNAFTDDKGTSRIP